jgi:DNA polymerase alpha subunit A
MKQRGGSARSGDVIPYIFCLAEGQESAKSAQADRAKHPDELRKAGAALTIGLFVSCTFTSLLNISVDYEHYLSQQILPPVERLCDPIEGTERARLAECLGWYLFLLHFDSQPTLVRTGSNALSTNNGLK